MAINKLSKMFNLSRVAHILNGATLILNKGSDDGIEIGDSFFVYGLSEEEIIDPDTGLSLGRLEIVRGTGVVTYVQAVMCTLQRPSPSNWADTLQQKPQTFIPFDTAQIGDYAKFVPKKE